MDPLTLVVLLVVAWMVFGDQGGRGTNTAGAAGPGAAPSIAPQQGANSPLQIDQSIVVSCPPGTMWNGRGCTEPPHQSTDQTAQPIGSDVGEDVPIVPLRASDARPETYGQSPDYVPPPPRTTAQHQLRALSSIRGLTPPRSTKPSGGGGFLS